MTRKEALAEFRETILPEVRRQYERDGRVDGPARREAWNNWTDMLCKERRITRRQCDTWSNPF